MGDKAESKRMMEQAGVPTIPGHDGELSGNIDSIAKEIGFPLMVKAAAGGGGKGMRAVYKSEDLSGAIESAKNEARNSFGNDTLILERFLDRPRHIEVQVLADSHGNTLHLGTRDCSAQRRHQKLIEEAPASGIEPDVLLSMGEAAVAVAEGCDYVNAGTVEFLYENGAFYYLEMYTRLKVEHTVTEEVTGLDLVELQLQISGGSSLADLDLTKEKVPMPRGTAMQLRINTETMLADGSIKPSGGYLTAFEAPSGRGIRVDSYGYPGYATNPAYDSLLAKLIVHASSCLLYTSPSPRDGLLSRMPSSA